jgi:hypothetical protein
MTFPGTPLITVNITPEAVAGITTAMVGITQIVKWAGLDPKHAPLVLAILSFLIVNIWVFMPSLYQIIVAASLVMMGASGVYGLATRQKPTDPPPAPPAVVTE